MKWKAQCSTLVKGGIMAYRLHEAILILGRLKQYCSYSKNRYLIKVVLNFMEALYWQVKHLYLGESSYLALLAV